MAELVVKRKLEPVWVRTRNVRNFENMMERLALGEDGRFALVWGQAGRGKTRTVQKRAAEAGDVYLYMQSVWGTGVTEFLAALARELRILDPPRMKGRCFAAIVNALAAAPRLVFIDEVEKMPKIFGETLRDLAELTGCAVVLVGEEELPASLRQNRRVWSRTYQQMEFLPAEAADIVAYARDAGGLSLSAAAAGTLHKASGGDWRLIKRDLAQVLAVVHAKGAAAADDAMVEMAIKAGLSGKPLRGFRGSPL